MLDKFYLMNESIIKSEVIISEHLDFGKVSILLRLLSYNPAIEP